MSGILGLESGHEEASPPCRLLVADHPIPGVADCALHLFPGAANRAAMLIPIPSGPEIRFDVVPAPVRIPLCRVVPVSIRWLPLVVLTRTGIRPGAVIGTPILVFSG